MKVNVAELLQILRNVTIFAGIPEENLRHISEQCDVVSFKSGEIIIKEDTPGKDIMVTLRGKVKIVLGMDRHPIEVVEFGPGNCLGEVSVIGILNHSASVVAVEDTDLMVISKQLLMGIFNEDKELFSIIILNIARELARRLHFTDSVLMEYGSKVRLAEKARLPQ